MNFLLQGYCGKNAHNIEQREVATNLILQLLLKDAIICCFDLNQEKKVNRKEILQLQGVSAPKS